MKNINFVPGNRGELLPNPEQIGSVLPFISTSLDQTHVAKKADKEHDEHKVFAAESLREGGYRLR